MSRLSAPSDTHSINPRSEEVRVGVLSQEGLGQSRQPSTRQNRPVFYSTGDRMDVTPMAKGRTGGGVGGVDVSTISKFVIAVRFNRMGLIPSRRYPICLHVVPNGGFTLFLMEASRCS